MMMRKYAKRTTAVVAAAAMMVSVCAMPVSATDTKSTDVTYTVTESYAWSVPSKIEFTSSTDTVKADDDDGNTQKVKVTQNVIGENTKLKITAAGSGTDNAFTIKTSKAVDILPYTIKVGASTDALAVNGTVLEVNAGTNTGSADLTFSLEKKTVEKAGNYNGSVIYTAAVVAQ